LCERERERRDELDGFKMRRRGGVEGRRRKRKERMIGLVEEVR